MLKFKFPYRSCTTAGPFGMPLCLFMRFFRVRQYGKGDVEVFDLTGHPKAKRAYAWSHLDGDKDERTRFVAVLKFRQLNPQRRL